MRCAKKNGKTHQLEDAKILKKGRCGNMDYLIFIFRHCMHVAFDKIKSICNALQIEWLTVKQRYDFYNEELFSS